MYASATCILAHAAFGTAQFHTTLAYVKALHGGLEMKKFNLNKRFAAPIAALAILAGCTTATPYQPLGATTVRGGYVD